MEIILKTNSELFYCIFSCVPELRVPKIGHASSNIFTAFKHI